jgi:sigma-B regulation protein RsbU (phosphoserine phosphatase)
MTTLEPVHAFQASHYPARMDRDVLDARILLIDDSRASRLITESCLRSAGFHHFGYAHEGAEALKTAVSFQPELVITDLVMPGMDGFELCRSLRADPVFAAVPIIALTGLSKAEGRAEAFACGATDLVSKPLNAPELVSRAKMHLEHRLMTGRLTEYRRRMAREIDIARSMQHSLMPDAELIQRFRSACPVDIASLYEPSEELGGDLWGLESLGDGKLRLYSADFAGHGVVSAFNTFRLHSYLHSGVLTELRPAAWLGEVNRFLEQVLPVGQFATMFCAEFDLNDNRLTCASAAAPPVLVSTGGDYRQLNLSGLPLGIVEDGGWEECELPFPAGSTLFVYSDALIETPSPCAPVIAPHEVAGVLNDLGSVPVETIITALRNRLDTAIGAGLGDDLTLVALRHEERPA